MYTYHVRTGALNDPAGTRLAMGYSGRGDGLNNPILERVQAVGPIPRGLWRMGGIADDDHTGPFSILLVPSPEVDVFGRSGFRCHGDNRNGDHSASHGCIILPRPVREAMWNSGDKLIEVVA